MEKLTLDNNNEQEACCVTRVDTGECKTSNSNFVQDVDCKVGRLGMCFYCGTETSITKCQSHNDHVVCCACLSTRRTCVECSREKQLSDFTAINSPLCTACDDCVLRWHCGICYAENDALLMTCKRCLSPRFTRRTLHVTPSPQRCTESGVTSTPTVSRSCPSSLTDNNKNKKKKYRVPIVPVQAITEQSALYCQLHLGLLRQPVMNSACGHTYCSSCIQSWKAQLQNSCPSCRCELANLIPNLTVNHLLDTLEIHCRYGCKLVEQNERNTADADEKDYIVDPDGCPEYVILQDRSLHEEVCQYAPVPCPFGSAACKVLRRDVEKHTQTCPLGIVTSQADIVKLNVGGTLFATSKATLCKYESKLKYIVENEAVYRELPRDEQGAIFLDQDPTVFSTLLQFLRGGEAQLKLSQQELTCYGWSTPMQAAKKADTGSAAILCDGIYVGNETGAVLWFTSQDFCHFVGCNVAWGSSSPYSSTILWRGSKGYVEKDSFPKSDQAFACMQIICVGNDNRWGHDLLLTNQGGRKLATFHFEPFPVLSEHDKLQFVDTSHGSLCVTHSDVVKHGSVHSWKISSGRGGSSKTMYAVLGQHGAIVDFTSSSMTEAVACRYFKVD